MTQSDEEQMHDKYQRDSAYNEWRVSDRTARSRLEGCSNDLWNDVSWPSFTLRSQSSFYCKEQNAMWCVRRNRAV